MSNDRVRIGRLSFKGRNDAKAKSILTVWRGSNGGYSISKDKHSDQYPAIGLFEALKAWGTGEGFLDFWPADAARGGSQPRTQNTQSAPSNDEWNDDDPVF